MGLTDAMLKYLKPSMRPWLVLSGVALVVVGIVVIVGARRERNHHTHATRVAWLLVAPAVVLVLFGSQALGPYAVGQSANRWLPDYAFDLAGYARQHHTSTPTLELADIAEGVHDKTNRRFLQTHDVRLTGFITDIGAADHEFTLTRLLISCCAADATPTELHMVGAQDIPKVGRWVEVTARLLPATRGADPYADPEMQLRSLHAVREPSAPYETLR
jgi:uncharacterized repeat protein (TIGR03943 family)